VVTRVTDHAGQKSIVLVRSGGNCTYGCTPHDRLKQAQVTVHRRDWHLLGFSPRLALLYTRRDSNLALYDFRRMQFLIGFTREF
jgi:hypothetical protein